jgi:hypothetical protein
MMVMAITKQRLHILPSSSGLTGRSGIPRAFASKGGHDEREIDRNLK